MSLQGICIAVCALLIVIAIAVCMADHDARRPHQNIRLPRRGTLWGRTNKYHEGKS